MLSVISLYRFLCAGLAGCFIISAAYGLSESTGPGGSNAQAVHAAGYDGQGVAIGLISFSNILDTHEAFKDAFGNPRAFNIDIGHGVVSPPSTYDYLLNHDTRAAGIAIARGTGSHPNDNGAAPAATLYSAAVFNYSSDIATAVAMMTNASRQCRVIMAVLQDEISDADAFWPLLYDYYAYAHNIVFANAAGNYDADSYPTHTPPSNPGVAFNGITTGGLITTPSTDQFDYDKIGSLSLAGQTADGRKKPDVGAPSSNQTVPNYTGTTVWGSVPGTTQGYTSYAVPHTAGVAALLLDYADSSADPDDDKNVVIKAVIVNSTFPNILAKNGSSTVEYLEAEPNWPWHTDRGYGRLDAYRALQLLQSDRITPGQSTNDPGRWAYATLPASQTHYYWVQGCMNERLVATLTWNRRVEWNDPRGPGWGTVQPGELTGFLENLDLGIYDSDGLALMPEPSTVDNLEKVDIRLLKNDTYEIRIVNHSSTESAAYGLAFEVLAPLVGDVHVDYVVDLLDAADVAQYWLDTNCDTPGQACYAYNISPNAAIDLSDFALLAGNWLNYDERYYTP